MEDFLTAVKTALVIAALTMIIPLAVWAATGSLARARDALKGYVQAMAWIVVPAVVLGIAAALIT
jgi:uncharacterized membrane protein